MNKKSLIIDLAVLKEHNITIEEILFLYSTYTKIDISIVTDVINLEKLQKNLFIKKIDNEIHLRQKTIDLIDFLSIETEGTFKVAKNKTKSKRVILSTVKDRVEEFRNKWRGLKPGSMGSKKSCEQKLSRWMKENPEYSFDEILQAVDLYLNTEGRDLRFLQRADYFIYKQDNNKEENSRLSAYIDDLENSVTDDWTTKLI